MQRSEQKKKKKKKACYVSLQQFWYKEYVYINRYIYINTLDLKECLVYTNYHV